MSSLREQKIELYLKRLTAHLIWMPRREKDEVRQEVRLHLEALIATHEFEGKSEEETVEAALHQFGDPRKIGKEMARSWWKKRRRQMAAERAAREATKPISQRRRERVAYWLKFFISGAGYGVLGFMAFGPTPPIETPFQLWVKFLTVVAAIGVVTGFIGALQPSDAEEGLLPLIRQEPEVKSEGSNLAELSLPPLPKDASLRRKLRRIFSFGILGLVRRHRSQHPPKRSVPVLPGSDATEVIASMFALCVTLVVLAMLPIGPESKRLFVALSLMWTTESISQFFWRRLLAKRRSARM
jgi:hypothetical protein